MDSTPKNTSGASACLILVLAVLLVPGCGQPQQRLVTGLSLREMSGAGTPFHGYYVADGITNRMQGLMPTNFAFQARSLDFEVIAEQKPPLGFELTVSRSDGSRTAHAHTTARGHMILKRGLGEDWFSEPD